MAKPARKVIRSVEQYVRALESNGLRIIAAYLFGSRARGDHRPDSDIDVAVICKGLSRDFARSTQQLWRPRRAIDTRIEPVAFRPAEFRDEDPLVWEIKQHGIRIK